MRRGLSQDAFSRFGVSCDPSYHRENKFLQHDLMGSGMQCPDSDVGLVLTNSAALVSHHFHVHDVSCSTGSLSRKKVMPNSVHSRRELRMVLLEQVGFQKTFPGVRTVFRVSSGDPESRPSTVLGLGTFKGWLGTWDALELLAVSGS